MAERMSVDDIRERLRNDSWTKAPFQILRILGRLCGQDERIARELTIRALEHRKKLPDDVRPILDSLVGRLGLFPYLDDLSGLNSTELLVYEFHRPIDMDERDIVFHAAQARAYRALLDGENLILSAPTSFGKSLLIDAMIALGKFANVVVIVPTIALIDETRRRLARFKKDYKLITHGTQSLADKNVFLMTQERFLALDEIPPVDFFVIDEFYKLDPTAESGNSDRAYLLNETFYHLYKTGAQFYLLGPNIQRIAESIEMNLSYHFLRLDFETVVTEVKRVAPNPSVDVATTQLLKTLSEPTLVFCKSPNSARRLARHLLDSGFDTIPSEEISEAADWIASNYHDEWDFVKALRRGVGIHHGKLPRAIGQFVIRAFEKGELSTLLCTSTLIEGVNTAAKNVIVFDNSIARDKLDFFTFSNIRGRSGRMFRHFIGYVYVLDEPPEYSAHSLDFPMITQGDDVPTELLVQIDHQDLRDNARERIRPILEQEVLSLESIRRAHGVKPERLISLANALRALIFNNNFSFVWTGLPRYQELLSVSDLIWTHLLEFNVKQYHQGVASSKQLVFFLGKLKAEGLYGLILDGINNSNEEPGEVVERKIDFVRYWVQFLFPKMLRAFHVVQEEVLSGFGYSSGNYLWYAEQLECLFTHPSLMALEEFGLPLEIGQKIAPELKDLEDLDSVLKQIYFNDFKSVVLTRFERSLLDALRKSLVF